MQISLKPLIQPSLLIYDSNLDFPLFGSVSIPLLYMALVVFMIPIMGNTINSIDVLNGVASGFITIASFALSICLFILENYEIGVVCLCLAFSSHEEYSVLGTDTIDCIIFKDQQKCRLANLT